MPRTDLDHLPRLSDAQRRLVEDNCGLVAVHLRRHVFNLRHPRREREWDDLFQEGCIGLMRAAARFDAASGIPFAAFALPRIHQAVSLALQERFSLVRDPGRARRKRRSAAERDDGEAGAAATRDRHHPGCAPHGQADSLSAPPRVVPLDDGAADRVPDRRHRPAPDDADTIADYIRRKRRRAGASAARTLSLARGCRADRPAMVQRIETERLAIEASEYRTSLRQIAREANCAFARVARCDKLLAEQAVERLRRDPELAELARLASVSELGLDAPLDAASWDRINTAAAEQIARQAAAGDPETRGRLFAHLTADLPRSRFVDLVKELYRRLPEERREAIVDGDACPQEPPLIK